MTCLVWGGAALALAWLFREALTPFVLAFLIAYALNPALTWMEERKVSRTAGVVLLLLGSLGILAGCALVLYPAVESEVRHWAMRMPAYAAVAVERLRPFLERAGVAFGHDADSALRAGMERLGSIPLEIVKGVYYMAASAASSLPALAGALLGFLIVPIAAFHFMRDYDRMRERAFSFVPMRHRPLIAEIFADVNRTLASYVRGQLLVVLTLATLFSAGLWMIGIPMGIFIGMLAGAANVVPYMPLLVGLLPSLALAYLQYGDPWHLLMVGGLFLAVQTFEGLYLTPKVMGSAVGLHPVAIMLAVFTGGILFGFIGVISAVPCAAVIKVLAVHAERHYRTTNFFRGE